jgi:hypothetical protein
MTSGPYLNLAGRTKLWSGMVQLIARSVCSANEPGLIDLLRRPHNAW